MLRKKLYSHGFSVLEIVVSIMLIGIILYSSLQSFRTYQQSRFDARARADLVRIREAVYKKDEQAKKNPDLMLFHQRGTEPFPAPFSQVKLSSGVTAPFVVKLKRRRGEIVLISVRHEKGAHEYRWIDIYGSRRQQKIPFS